MARQLSIAIENNFLQGLITDASGLKFPEHACTETYNCTFNTTGLVSRRQGFDNEDNYDTASVDVAGNVVVSYRWDNASGAGDIVFIVTQVGDTLRFYRVTADTPLSSNLHATTIALSTYFTSGTTTVRTSECQFTSGYGVLFVTNPKLESFYVSYNSTTDAITATQILLQTRDFEGDTADTETIVSRPTATLAGMNAHHRYNLENQGWTTTTLTAWDTARADMPSNADAPFFYKNSSDAYDFSIVANYTIGNSRIQGGHFIYDVYNTNRASNVTSATESSITTDRVTTCAFFAGRAWYAGLATSTKASKIFFSQILESTAQVGYCYSLNDPTSETVFDSLPSDGGVIDIIDNGTVFKMVPYLNALLVFCSNGVWAISGSQGIGFTATDFSISKLSDYRSISHTSFVIADGSPFWWNHDGIYKVSKNPQTGTTEATCISDFRIRGFLYDIPTNSKLYVRGAYDPISKTIQWLYKAEDVTSFETRFAFDRVLVFNVLTQAFYPWSVNIDNVKIHAIVDIFGLSGSLTSNQVVNGADTVVNGADNVIVFAASTGGSSSSVVKYLISYDVSGTNKMTWAEARNSTEWLDWYTYDGVGTDYDSYADTAYKIKGDAIRKFQSNYIRVYTSNTRTSSFNVQAKWDYAISGNSGRWSNVQTIVMDNESLYNNRTKRLKLRGHGLVMQLRFSSVTGSPFDIIGWVTYDSANKGI